MDNRFTRRGFLPARDPLREFANDSPLAILDRVGQDLPSLLTDPGCRAFLRELKIPPWQAPADPDEAISSLHLYYVRLGFLTSAYINQVGQPATNVLPRNIAAPLCEA